MMPVYKNKDNESIKMLKNKLRFTSVKEAMHETVMFNCCEKNKALVSKKGFTLAEVLITLTIIGVVAAMTIPVLINKYQKTQYITGLKKIYTLGNQALQELALDYGCIGDLACTGLFASGNLQNFGDALSSKFKVIRNCGTTTNEDCFTSWNENYDGSGSTGYNYNTAAATYKFVLADGMLMVISSNQDDCSSDRSINSSSPTKNICGEFIVDINGKKGPNYRGRDIFVFFITSNKTPRLYPTGGKDDNTMGGGVTEGAFYWNYNNRNRCSPDRAGTWEVSGHFCTGRIMDKGWVMDY